MLDAAGGAGEGRGVSRTGKMAQVAKLVGKSRLAQSLRRSMTALSLKTGGGERGLSDLEGWRQVRKTVSDDFGAHAAHMESEVSLHVATVDDAAPWAGASSALPRGEDVLSVSASNGGVAVLVCGSGRAYTVRDGHPEEIALPRVRCVQAACGRDGAALLSADGRVFLHSFERSGTSARETALPEAEPASQLAITGSGDVFALGASGRVYRVAESVKSPLDNPELVGGALSGVAVASLAAGADHVVAITASGRVYGWGSNAEGQLGLREDVVPFAAARRLPVSFPVRVAACGESHTVLAGLGGAWLWLGAGASACAAAADFFEAAQLDVASVACGAAHAALLTTSGELFVLQAGASAPEQITFGDDEAQGGCFAAACAGGTTLAMCAGAHDARVAAARRERAAELRGRALRMAWPSGGEILRAAEAVAPGKKGDTAELERLLKLALKDVHMLGGSVAAPLAGPSVDSARAAELAKQCNGQESSFTAAAQEAWDLADAQIGSGVDLEGLQRSLLLAVKTVTRVSYAKHRDHRAFKTFSSLAAGAVDALEALTTENSEPDVLRGYFWLLVSPLALVARPEHDILTLALEGGVVPAAAAQTVLRWVFLEVPGDMLGRFLVARVVDAIDELIATRQLDSQVMQRRCRFARRLYLLNEERFRLQASAMGRGGDGGAGGARLMALPSEQPVLRERFCTQNLMRASPQFVQGYFQSWRNARERRNAPFSLLRHPFLLGADLKTELLKMEDEEAMRRSIFFGGAREVPYFVLQVRRESLLDDVLQQLTRAASAELKRPLMVVFHNGGRPEEGQDAGGVKKEFFQLLSAQLFSPDFGMFAPVGMRARTGGDDGPEAARLWFNVSPHSAVFADASMYEVVGKLLGMALYNGTILDMRFVRAFYRLLLGKLPAKPGLTELEELNPSLAAGLAQMLDWKGDDFGDVFLETFEAPAHVTLSGQPEPLCEGGSDMEVTKANRHEYVSLYTKYLLVDAVKPMAEKLLLGFGALIPPGLASLSLFRPDELELALTGSDVLDFEALRETTRYVGGYSSSHRTVQWFWEVVEGFTDAQKHDFVRFATGAPKPPVGGMAALHFVLQRAGPDSSQLPTASTCFNTLLLPEYASKEKLRERLLLAIQNSQGFGLR